MFSYLEHSVDGRSTVPWMVREGTVTGTHQRQTWALALECLDSDPAWKSGSDSLLMKLRRRIGFDQRQGIKAMQGLDVSELVRRGFVVESATKGDGDFVIAVRGATTVCRMSGARRRLQPPSQPISETAGCSSGRRRTDSADFTVPPLLL
jgi:hypothetical protein